jgi:myosin-crossreactive antigen
LVYQAELWKNIDSQNTQKMPDSNPKLRILIAGSGIAGLATAIAISRISDIPGDVDIQRFEQAPQLTEIGASIALSPNVGGNHTLNT